MFAPPNINELEEGVSLEDALEEFIHEDFAGGIVPHYYRALLQKCNYSEQQFIEKKDELKDLIGKNHVVVLQFDFGLSVEDCDALTENQINDIKDSLIAGFRFIKTHGHQSDFEHARFLMEEVFGIVFEAHFGHPPPDEEPAPVPLPVHNPPQEGGRRRTRSRLFSSSCRKTKMKHSKRSRRTTKGKGKKKRRTTHRR